jgi:uncharacterized BrkB/YihY/UPF0761 family membrane protein
MDKGLQDVKLEGILNSLAKSYQLTSRTVTTIKESRIFRFRALLSYQSIIFPFFLSVFSLISFIG